MTRLLVHVEGETEEAFVNNILGPHLYRFGFHSVRARLIGRTPQRSHRGGIGAWTGVRKQIVNHLREDRHCVATTMVDYYGLPQDGPRAWPGRATATRLEHSNKAGEIEAQLAQDVTRIMGPGFDKHRFVPYVAMHEFEAMLFSDCARFAAGIGRPELESRFRAIRDRFSSPEDIDDSPESAPSAQILRLVPGYRKPTMGNRASLQIGLERIRDECPNFRRWLERLEAIAA